MAVTEVVVQRRTPYESGRAFGDTGPYERLDGTVHYAVDPAHPANSGIVDLDQAPRDAEGRVRFVGDFCLLQPADPQRGNGRLLLDVPNRGRKVAVRMFNRARPDPAPTEAIDPGDGFLMRHGWAVAWCGWQWDVPRSPALMGLEAPLAQAASSVGATAAPLAGQVIVEIQPNEPCADHLLANRVHHPYPAADVDDPHAVLTVRDWADGPRTTIPRDQWRFARAERGEPVPDDARVWLAGGFAPGRLYEVVYCTRHCPVVGAGPLAVRDCAAFLRHAGADAGNPCAGRLSHTYGFGVSQTGRFLRHFLYLGLNVDEAGRQVFDGLWPHVAGARRGEFNHRFAQPSAQSVRGFGHLMPFAFDDQTDPATGETDGLLRRQRARASALRTSHVDSTVPEAVRSRPVFPLSIEMERGLGGEVRPGVPKIVATNTSAEYWRGDCSLLHTDLAGERDVEPPAEVRVYHFAGTQHGPGALPLGRVSPADGQSGLHPFNAVDYAPLLRAALVNLDLWVTSGEPPPHSVFPRLANGTAAPAPDVVAAFRAVPGVTLPAPDRLPVMRRLDLGPDAGAGVGRYPATAGEPYPAVVSAVDGDGNEVGGIRLPDLSVPVATYTGWNPRDPATGGAGQIINMQGSTIPFPATAEERRRTADPRPAIAERYRDRADYLGQVRTAAEHLVAERLMLAEDVDVVVGLAADRYDCFATAPVPG